MTLFKELKQSLEEIILHQQGKITLRTHIYSIPEVPKLKPDDITIIRNKMNMSQAIFAIYCNVSKKTIQAWEQGIRKPSGIAMRLLDILKNHSETVLHS